MTGGEQETLADVSAWCRDIARSYRNTPANKIEIEGLKVCDYIDELANRIDAAAKRAEAKWEGAACACVSDAVMSGKIAVEHKPAGNSDALRWALSGIRLWFVAAANVLDEDASARVTPKALRKLAKDCDAALAAPAVDCPPSNVAALRDALVAILNFALACYDKELSEGTQVLNWEAVVVRRCNYSLTKPPRNCDVGTAEEQAERYMKFCKNYPKCIGCPCVGRMQYHQCEFAWSQMPYQEGGAE